MAIDPLPRDAGHARLRRLRLDDLVDFQSYRTDPVVARYQGWAQMTDGQAREFLIEMQRAPLFADDTWVQIGIADWSTDVLIGDIGIHVDLRGGEAELGCSLSRPWQRRGLALDAMRGAVALVLEQARVSRIVCHTDTRNAAAQRLLERLGFSCTGSRDALARGEPCREHVFVRRRTVSGMGAGSP